MATRRSSRRRSSTKGHGEEGGEDEPFNKSDLMRKYYEDMPEMCQKDSYNHPEMYITMDPADFSLDYLRKNGFDTPIYFPGPARDLGMTLPDAETFTVDDVVRLVGGEKNIDVIEVSQQAGRHMTLEKFVRYYNDPDRLKTGLFNVLSLEFSLTNLEKVVQCPEIVKKIGWVERYWPKEFRQRQQLSIEQGRSNYYGYPKVQYYCLMSVATCFTDFHIDFGGTSVWYHILKGRKIFWLIEPTEHNLILYEQWVKGGHDSFFGNVVEKSARVELKAGDTFMIPSGWIHCVYTPEDSLVFGGNFMHSFSVGMQLRVPKLERRLKITKKYRYPFFGETLWYVASGVVLDGTGKKHVRELPIVLPDEKPVKEEEDEEEEHYESDEDATPAKVKREGKTEKRQEPVKKMASNNGTAVKQEAETDLETKDVKKMEMQEPDATAPEALGTDSELLDSKEEIGCKIGYPSPPELIQEPSPKKLKQSMEEEDEDTVYIYGDDGTSKSAVHLNASSESASLESSSRPETPSRVHALNNSYSHITNPPLDEYTFNEEYLTSLSMHERHGLKILADFLHKVLKRKKQDLAEGIDDPKELLKDLYACLRKAAELNPIGEKGENDDDDEMPLLDPEEDNRQPFPEDKNPKKPKTPKGPALKKGTATKKKTPAKTKTPRAKAKKEEIIPDIIDGMPRPTQKVAKENSYGYDPLANVSALGHAPLQSAFRRTANMAKPPPNQKFVNANLTKIQIPTESPNSSAPPSAVSPAIPTFSPRARNAPSTPLYKDGKAIDPTTGMVDLFHSTPSTSTPSEQFSPRMSPLDSDSGKARPLRRFSDVSDSGSPKIAPPKKFSAQKDRTVAPPKLLSDVSVVSPAKKTTVQQDPRNFESLKNSMGYKEATTDDLHSTGLGMSFPIKSPSEEALRKTSDIDRNRNSILSTPVDGVASDPVELSRLLADATVQYDKYPTNIM